MVADLMKKIVAFKYGTISSLSAGGYYDLQIANGGILIINHNGTGTCVACVVTYGGIYPIGKARHASVSGDSSISDSGKVNINVSKGGGNFVRITSNVELSNIYYLLLGEKTLLGA